MTTAKSSQKQSSRRYCPRTLSLQQPTTTNMRQRRVAAGNNKNRLENCSVVFDKIYKRHGAWTFKNNCNSTDTLEQYGKAHYTTPDISVAEEYACHVVHGGKTVMYVLQCRVNPDNMLIKKDGKYWRSTWR